MAYYGPIPIKVGAASESTWPLQPAFFAYLASTQANKTGNGALYTLGTNALTEIFDAGGDFNTNGTFTAPVTGHYLFITVIQLSVLTALGNKVQIAPVTSNRNYFLNTLNSGTARTAAGEISVENTFFADMDAMDTCTIRISVDGETADTVSISGNANIITFFSGCLLN